MSSLPLAVDGGQGLQDDLHDDIYPELFVAGDEEDGLEAYASPESLDELFLGETGQGTDNTDLSATAQDLTQRRWKIKHEAGVHKLKAAEFIATTTAGNFSPARALDMLQRRYTLDYGSRRSGSMPAREQDQYIPVFYLDFIGIVGRPLHPISRHTDRFFDNVTVSLQHWHGPYKAKHMQKLPFNLMHRTFRLATGASREVWFVVMHPVRAQVTELLELRQEQRRQQEEASHRSALERHHAEVLAAYIKAVFLSGELLGEGIEPSWGLDERRSQTIAFNQWQTFQELFVQGWDAFVAQHNHDAFWVENQPAFHAYDYGANIEIEETPELANLDRAMQLRLADDSGSDVSDDEGSPGSTSRAGEGTRQEDNDDEEEEEGRQDALFGGGLGTLRTELEQKYELDHIDTISYALAVNLHCLEAVERPVEEDETGQEQQAPPSALCLLADRNAIADEYGRTSDYTFYPLGFHPSYGNFTSTRPPAFLANSLLTILQDNMSLQNGGADVLSFGYFQGYSNIKRSIRARPDDLLASKGIATAALTLPAAEAKSNSRVGARQQRLLRQLCGGLTPGEPDASTPFARERQRIEAAMAEEEFAFRIEQVASIHVQRLVPGRRAFTSVLQPIFQLMRFFLREKQAYTHILRRFPPAVFPGILRAFARVFELAIGEMAQRFRAGGAAGLGLALAEGVAALDRLGHYCFTGDGRVLPRSVMKPLGTMDALLQAAWPFVDPALLDFREGPGRIFVARWPQGSDRRPLLMHVAALAFQYGRVVAMNRQTQLRFGELGCQAIRNAHGAARFLEEVFLDLWVPQTKTFVAYQLRRYVGTVLGATNAVEPSGDNETATTVRVALEAWEKSDDAFRWRSFERLTNACGIVTNKKGSNAIELAMKTRRDAAEELYTALVQAKGATASGGFASKHATWFAAIRGAMQKTPNGVLTKELWVDALAAAMLASNIEWMPGTHSARITHRRVVRLLGTVMPTKVLAARPGSLKRAALEAEVRHQDAEGARKEARRARIDFGEPIPFKRVPALIQEGFARTRELFAKGDQKVLEHYQAAQFCLHRWLETPSCDLMLMLVLTLASSSVTPQVAPGTHEFSAANRRKEPALLAANMVTRMMWFLDPKAFPWDKDVGQVLRVSEMTKKIEHKGVSNRVLRELKWIRVKGNRDSPRNSDVTLQDETVLWDRRKDLLAMRKHPERFIASVFCSREPIWVERCSSIIVDQ